MKKHEIELPEEIEISDDLFRLMYNEKKVKKLKK